MYFQGILHVLEFLPRVYFPVISTRFVINKRDKIGLKVKFKNVTSPKSEGNARKRMTNESYRVDHNFSVCVSRVFPAVSKDINSDYR